MMKQSIISKYRTELMGFAVLWIAFLHARMWFRFLPLQIFKLTGHGGVDVFLFLSSFGLYYAYQKGTHGFSFFLKRLWRILPTYWLVALARIVYHHYDWNSGLMLMSTLIFWFYNDRTMWFVSGIIVLYAMSPIYLKYFKDGREEKMTLVSILVAFLISILLKDKLPLLFLARIPVFLLGFLAGKYAYEDRPVGKTWPYVVSFLLGCVLLYIGFSLDEGDNVLWGQGMYWYPNLFIVWPLCLGLSKVFTICETKAKWINSCFYHLGVVSFEFYLLHELAVEFFGARMTFSYPFEYNGILENCLIIGITYVMAVVLHAVVQFGMQKLGKENNV